MRYIFRQVEIHRFPIMLIPNCHEREIFLRLRQNVLNNASSLLMVKKEGVLVSERNHGG